MSIDGMSSCIHAVKDIEKGNIHHCFLEMSACPGSCIGGPAMEKNHRAPVRDYITVSYTHLDVYKRQGLYMSKTTNKARMQKTFRLVELALLTAIIAVMTFTPIGYLDVYKRQGMPFAIRSIRLQRQKKRVFR